MDSSVPKLDREVFELVNKVRQDPRGFIQSLNKVLNQLDGEVIKREGKTNIRTNEGAKAVKEAIEYLNKADKAPPLVWSMELSKACKEHVSDVGPKGLMQHEGSNGTTVKERISNHGKILNCYGENLAFHCDDAEEVLQQLIIDDGVHERGHRENIFNKEFKVFGCYSGPHRDFEQMCCMDFAGGIVKTGDKDPIEEQMQLFLKENVEFDMP